MTLERGKGNYLAVEDSLLLVVDYSHIEKNNKRNIIGLNRYLLVANSSFFIKIPIILYIF